MLQQTWGLLSHCKVAKLLATEADILLIDGDMRRPSLHKLLGKSREPGLSTFLTQQVSAESVVVETDTPGLYFIPAGPKPPPKPLLRIPAR